MRNILLSLSLLVSTFAFSQKKILFIGNSYTYVNDLPFMVSQLAAAAGDSLYDDSSTPGGYTLQGHSTLPATLSKINSLPWDYVVLQEQSQIPSFPQGQVDSMMFPPAILLDSLIHSNDPCTQTVFYMTWGRKYGDVDYCPVNPPVCTYAGMQEGLRRSYLRVADSLHAKVSPVGISFQNCIASDSTIELYQSDFSHPSVEGTYLAACTFYSTFFKRSPVGNAFISSLDSATAAFLQNIASHTVLDSLSTWNIGSNEPNATFTFTQNGLNAAFNSDSTHGSFHSWSFGASVFNPVYTFPSGGDFAVSHIVCDSCRCDTSTMMIHISAIGIDENDPASRIIIYPNPVIDRVTIEMPDEPGNFSQVELLDISGRTLQKFEFQKTHRRTFFMNDLEKGIYFLCLKNTYTGTVVKKIILE